MWVWFGTIVVVILKKKTKKHELLVGNGTQTADVLYTNPSTPLF